MNLLFNKHSNSPLKQHEDPSKSKLFFFDVHAIYLVGRISLQSSVLTTRLKLQATFRESFFNQMHT